MLATSLFAQLSERIEFFVVIFLHSTNYISVEGVSLLSWEKHIFPIVLRVGLQELTLKRQVL